MRWRALIAALLLAAPVAAQEAPCRQALALGLDVSGSVDSAEYALQLRGLANALRHPEVVAALLAEPSAPVEIAVYVWSGPGYQRLIADWVRITGPADIVALAGQVLAAARHSAPPETALGRTMAFGAALLGQRQGCWKRTLDISGDGKNNAGPRPEAVRATLAGEGITINGLVIGSDARRGGDMRYVEIGELAAYFQAYVILGPDAFVETALGYANYEAAMVRKLKRELEGLALSALQ
ncbi:DUF1194 domain-containing protein [Seohaeicola zhoushanensis]|uniref:VWFA domain-containing protein n=1 Tax=Seohaeicola zhoushanensis TaxID=1569283 RepID=A0A8J3MB65_9RHOB|nr:DUF1194 domain-containing protein [Seohaeicola zhoushanensis]GHF73529.1 hypothetical protein GCM10017056_50480 [Seohaeicola zhoushanensis]